MLQNISEEIRGLEAERTELGLHIEQTEAWTQHLGRWEQWLQSLYTMSISWIIKVQFRQLSFKIPRLVHQVR